MAVSRVASATSSTSLLSVDTSRKTVIIENSDANRLHIRLDGGTAAADDYSISLAQYENAELEGDQAKGAITGIWAGDGSGYAHLTVKF